MIKEEAKILWIDKQKYEFEAQIEQESLLLKIVTKCSEGKHYQSKYTYEQLPNVCQLICSQIEEVFQMFKSEQSYEVDYHKGQITLKFEVIKQGKKIPRQAMLKLQRLDISESTKIAMDLKKISKKVIQLKQVQKQQSGQLSKQLSNLSTRVEEQNLQLSKKLTETEQEIKNMKHHQEQKILLISQQTQQQLLVVKKQIKQIYGVLNEYKVMMKQFQNTLLKKIQLVSKKSEQSTNWKQSLSQRVLSLEQKIFKQPYRFSSVDHHKDFTIHDEVTILSSSSQTQKMAAIKPLFKKQIQNYQITFQLNRCSDWIGVGICHLKALIEQQYQFKIDKPNKGIYFMTHNRSTFSAYGQNLWNKKSKFSGFGNNSNAFVNVYVDTKANLITYINQQQDKYCMKYSPDLPIQEMCFCVFVDRKSDCVSIQGQM